MPRTPLRIADLAVLNAELAAWANATNADERQVDWRFTASDARCTIRGMCARFCRGPVRCPTWHHDEQAGGARG